MQARKGFQTRGLQGWAPRGKCDSIVGIVKASPFCDSGDSAANCIEYAGRVMYSRYVRTCIILRTTSN